METYDSADCTPSTMRNTQTMPIFCTPLGNGYYAQPSCADDQSSISLDTSYIIAQ